MFYATIRTLNGIEEVTCDYPETQEYVPLSLKVDCPDTKIRNGKEAAALMYTILPSKDKEYFIAAYLDTRNNLIKAEVISIGSVNASIVHPREVFKPAIILSAASVIIMHNHPSGDTSPSEADISVTRRLVETGKVCGISLLDHVIVGKTEGNSPCGSGFTSLAEEGLM